MLTGAIVRITWLIATIILQTIFLTSGEKKDACEGGQAAGDEAEHAPSTCSFEVSEEDGRPRNGRNSEEDELRWNHCEV